eukprot:7036855-Prymnesium_polylepis.2
MSGRARRLPVYVGMLGVITMNRTPRHPEYVNANVGVITHIEMGADGTPSVLHIHVLSTPENSPPVLLRREVTEKFVPGVGDCSRRQFEFIPAAAVTIHRVQGATLECAVHVLLNKEIFASGQVAVNHEHSLPLMCPTTHCPRPFALFVHTRQAYVAISRVRSLSQLHLWFLHREAFISDPRVTAEYGRLRTAPLTAEAVNSCLPRQPVRRLLPMAAVQVERARSDGIVHPVPCASVVPLSGTRELPSQVRRTITRVSF